MSTALWTSSHWSGAVATAASLVQGAGAGAGSAEAGGGAAGGAVGGWR